MEDFKMAEGKNIPLEIARLIGEPIDPNRPSPVALEEIANVETAEPGEIVKVFTAEDANADDIYAADAAGGLTIHKLSAISPATLTFDGLQSKLEYVLLDEILPAEDQGALARKKASITRAMDKEELRITIAAIKGVASQKVTAGAKLYEGILALKHKIENYGDNFVMLVSSDVSEAIDTYEIDQATTLNYKMSLRELLTNLGIKVIKIVGKVNGADLISAKTAILVARDSTLGAGKPIYFFRRKIGAEVAAQMGVPVGVRLISVAPVPTIINADSKNTLGYGCFGYESKILAITNYRCLAWADDMIA